MLLPFVFAGYGENPGIVPLFMEDVFSSDSTVQQTSVSCYMLELYQVRVHFQ